MWKESGNRYSGKWSGRETSRQDRPFSDPLPYLRFGGTAKRLNYPERGPLDICNLTPLANGYGWNVGVSEASNKALDKLYEKMEQAESLRVAWAEREKALSMVTSGLRTIVKIGRAIKRKDPKIIRQILRRNPEKKDILKTPSDIWLAYHFGIVPTISDIHHAMGVFAYDFPVDSFTVSASSRTNAYGDGATTTRLQRTTVKLGGEIYGFDPNVSLASRLGFGQPLSVAWEMTPFSWFVDYFVNVGQVIKNMEPRFPGVLTRKEFTTVFCRYAPTVEHFYEEQRVHSGHFLRRTMGWPNYSLEFSGPANLKGQQVSYIAAVAIQLLTGFKK